MSKLPQLNLRIPEQHHDVIRQIAQRLRDRNGDEFGAKLTYFLNDQPAPASLDGGALAGRMDDLEHRLSELEQWRQSFVLPPEPLDEITEVRPRVNEPFSDAVLIEADHLNSYGMKWEDVWLKMGRPGTVNGLRNAVKKRRARQDRDWVQEGT